MRPQQFQPDGPLTSGVGISSWHVTDIASPCHAHRAKHGLKGVAVRHRALGMSGMLRVPLLVPSRPSLPSSFMHSSRVRHMTLCTARRDSIAKNCVLVFWRR